MQLVPAVTELLIAEIMYLQYKDRNKPMFLYINSTGTTRADGETVRTCGPVPSSLLRIFKQQSVDFDHALPYMLVACTHRLDLRRRAQLSMTQ